MRLIALSLLLLACVPARAQDEPGKDDSLTIARLAMEAQLRIGDVQKQKGDLDGALRSYREALRLYHQALDRLETRLARARRVDRPGDRRPVARRADRPFTGGGSAEKGLSWLASVQKEDGHWEAGNKRLHVGVSGLAVLSFLRAGHTDRGADRYAKNVRLGLRYLLGEQRKDGVFGGRSTHSFIYNHALATQALCEAFTRTRNPRYKKPATDAVHFILMARNPYMGWRYEPRGGENDTSVTTLCVMALKSAEQAGLDVDAQAYVGAISWIDKMTNQQTGQVGYNYPGGSVARPEGKQDKFPPEKSQAMTAAGVLTRLLCGQEPGDNRITKGTGLCLETLPRWNTEAGTIDMYYWYVGTLAMHRVGGYAWTWWRRRLQEAAGDGQNADGSWAPVGVWGDDGGRVYATAAMTLSLLAR